MSKPAPLTPAQHSKTRVRPGVDASRFEAQQVLPVVMHEISQAGSECPIIFIGNPDNDQFQPAALLGLGKGENLMIKNQQWQGSYVPGILTNEPFRLMAVAPDSDEMALGIDESSPLVGGVKTAMGGIYLVDEQKLRELSDESLLELQKRGFLSAIYAHLMSQNQVRNLGRIKVAQERAAKA